MSDRSSELMTILEQTRENVSAYTGIKRQFIDQGWSELVAEHMVLEMLRVSHS